MRSVQDVLDAMTYRNPDQISDQTVQAMTDVRAAFMQLVCTVDHFIPDGRLKAIVYDELEAMLMRSIQALAIQGVKETP